ncbi:MAG: hypothetical protein HQM12_19635 [SAR324 cluster bacterium]|nr:hypothetical protein [SAR324 cluster bacterium]
MIDKLGDLIEYGIEGLEYIGTGCKTAAGSGSYNFYTGTKAAALFGIGGIGFSVLGPAILLLMAVGGVYWWYLSNQPGEVE